MTSYLSATAMPFGERMLYAGRMTLIGMLTIFAALSILWGALELFRFALEKARKKTAKESAPEKKAVAPTAPTQSAPAEGAVIAAITAAISEVLAAENGGAVPNFRVVSYRRTRGSHK